MTFRFNSIIKNKNLFTYLNKNIKEIGYIKTYLDTTPIITEHIINNDYKKLGIGSELLYKTESILFQDNQNIIINMWCLDRCFNNYLQYYNKKGYYECKTNKKNFFKTIDYEENIYYNLNLIKNINKFT